MTTAEAKHALITTVKNEIGYHEGDNNYNKYAIGMTKYYGWDVQNQPYCDIFTDWAFVKTFGGDAAAKMTYQPMGSFSALCRQSAQYFKNNNAWFTSPETGDVIFFYYDGAINHQGIVVEVSGGLVYTVEGNSGDAVRSNAYGTGTPTIAGYGRPNWSVVAGGDNNVPTTVATDTDVGSIAPTVKLCSFRAKAPLLQMGDKGTFVRILQLLLLERGQKLPRYGADADFGGETQNAVERFQKENALAVDSVVGEATWAKLFEV